MTPIFLLVKSAVAADEHGRIEVGKLDLSKVLDAAAAAAAKRPLAVGENMRSMKPVFYL